MELEMICQLKTSANICSFCNTRLFEIDTQFLDKSKVTLTAAKCSQCSMPHLLFSTVDCPTKIMKALETHSELLLSTPFIDIENEAALEGY